jgi:hypothetical protein
MDVVVRAERRSASGSAADSAATTTPERPIAASLPHLQLAVNVRRDRVSCCLRRRGLQWLLIAVSFLLARTNIAVFAKRVRALAGIVAATPSRFAIPARRLQELGMKGECAVHRHSVVRTSLQDASRTFWRRWRHDRPIDV